MGLKVTSSSAGEDGSSVAFSLRGHLLVLHVVMVVKMAEKGGIGWVYRVSIVFVLGLEVALIAQPK